LAWDAGRFQDGDAGLLQSLGFFLVFSVLLLAHFVFSLFVSKSRQERQVLVLWQAEATRHSWPVFYC
jgi:hypothetical protein